jgi:hypothetical protein
MTIRQDLDALVDSMESDYAGASTPLEQTRAVAAAALSSAYLIADALDDLLDRVAAGEQTNLDQQVTELKADVADLQRKLEHLRNTTKRSRR